MGIFGSAKKRLRDAVQREKKSEELDQRLVKDQEGIEEHLEEASELLQRGKNYSQAGETEMADINFLLAFAHFEAARNCAEDEEGLLERLVEQDNEIDEETGQVEEKLREHLGKTEHEDFRSAAQEILNGNNGRKVEKVSEKDMEKILEKHRS